MRKLTYLSIIFLMGGCASCPFIDPSGTLNGNLKWVGGNWIFNAGWLPWHTKQRLSCAEAQALGHPEWHRMDTDLARTLIEKGELDKFRYSQIPIPDPKKDRPVPAGWYYDSATKKWRFKYPPY